ncbi:UNVERIFIED_CONTAM: hypothetical protein FKN15_010470 [Acipenser sinensis]
MQGQQLTDLELKLTAAKKELEKATLDKDISLPWKSETLKTMTTNGEPVKKAEGPQPLMGEIRRILKSIEDNKKILENEDNKKETNGI